MECLSAPGLKVFRLYLLPHYRVQGILNRYEWYNPHSFDAERTTGHGV